MNNFPSTAHLEMIMRGERGLNGVQPLIAKGKACGIDCGEYEQAAQDLRAAIDAFRREFFADTLTPPSGTGVPTHGE